MRKVARERRDRALVEECVVEKVIWLVEKYGDVDHQKKKVKVERMQLVVEKNKVDAIVFQIDVIQRIKDVYVRIMGQEKYDMKMVFLMNQMPGMDRSATLSISSTQSLQGTPNISILE
jgi:hypothetical protein